MATQHFLSRKYLLPIFFLTISILASILRFATPVTVNKAALLLVQDMVERSISSHTAAHWTLSTNQLDIITNDAIDCTERIGRDYFLCTVEQMATETLELQDLQSSANDPVLRYFQGVAQFQSDPDKAIAVWATVPHVSRFLARQALKLLEQGDITRSIQITDAAVAASSELVPELAPAYLALCQAFIEQSDKAQAMDFCQKAENTNSSWANQVNIARIYLNIQENERALNIAMSLIERGEGVAPALRIRGTAYVALGDYENALADYSQLQALGPIDRYTIYELAVLYYKMNNLTQAQELFEKLQRNFSDERSEGFLKAIDAQLDTSQ